MNKKGISLIVLVITIIVMIILAASVVITLSNTGVINKANNAVQMTNEKQIEQIASLAWADAYADGKTSKAELKEAVNEALVKNKIDTDNIAVGVTEKGVTISDNIFEIYPLEVPMEKGVIIQLKARIPADYEDVYVTFERDGNTEKVTNYDVVDGVKVFSYNLGPQQMGKVVTAEFHAVHDETEINKTLESISVETYAKGIMNKTATELNISDDKYLTLKTLAADMLEYGAMAQIYTSTDVDALVNDGVTGKTTFSELIETDMKLTKSTSENTYFFAAGVYYTHINKMFVKFVATNIDNITMKISVDNNSITKTASDFEDNGSNNYRYYIENIEPKDYDKVYTIELYEGETLCQTLTYSIKSYVYSQQNLTESDGTTLSAAANLARALYNYSLSARDYLETK